MDIVLLQGNGRKPKASVALRLVNRLGTIPRLLASILLQFIQSEVCDYEEIHKDKSGERIKKRSKGNFIE